MCCFSRPVKYVGATQIFARPLSDGSQHLVYSMNFEASEELAMVLPLPVPPGAPEDAVRFINLEGYAKLFQDLARAFPAQLLQPRSAGFARMLASNAAPPLVVHDVGRFEASFVPRIADFARLDPRFTLAPEVWDKLPRYRDWGFAVFKLKPKARSWLQRVTGREPGRQTIHPMAFRFPRRDPSTLFFPTVHVHDGEVHARASFDHTLYCQLEGAPAPIDGALFGGWDRSAEPLGAFVDGARAADIVDAAASGLRVSLLGQLPNRDIEIAIPA